MIDPGWARPAMRSLGAGACYFLLVYAMGWVLGPIRSLWIEPWLGRVTGLLVEAPLLLAASAFAANAVTRIFAVPARWRERAAVGLTALALLLSAETVGEIMLRGVPLSGLLDGLRTGSGALSLAVFLLFAAMPTLAGWLRR